MCGMFHHMEREEAFVPFTLRAQPVQEQDAWSGRWVLENLR